MRSIFHHNSAELFFMVAQNVKNALRAQEFGEPAVRGWGGDGGLRAKASRSPKPPTGGENFTIRPGAEFFTMRSIFHHNSAELFFMVAQNVKNAPGAQEFGEPAVRERRTSLFALQPSNKGPHPIFTLYFIPCPLYFVFVVPNERRRGRAKPQQHQTRRGRRNKGRAHRARVLLHQTNATPLSP